MSEDIGPGIYTCNDSVFIINSWEHEYDRDMHYAVEITEDLIIYSYTKEEIIKMLPLVKFVKVL